MVMEEKELRKVLDSHKRWLKGEMGGERASLVGADLSDTKLAGLDLEGADLRGANLERADLSGADLSNTNMQEANLEGALLDGANLIETSLRGASLKEASLFRTDMTYADLRGANLQKAHLVQTLLYNAEFYGTTLRASLTGVGLIGAKDILAIGPIGSRGDITYAVNHSESIMIQCGCFWGTFEEWEDKCRRVYKGSTHHHGAVYEAAARFIRAYSLYWGRGEANVDAAKRWAEQKVEWLTDKLAYSCQCSRDTSCGIHDPCPLDIGINCLDVEPSDWANLAAKKWEE